MVQLENIAICTTCDFQEDLSEIDEKECPECGGELTFREND